MNTDGLTPLLQEALARVLALPPEQQDEIARAVLELAEISDVPPLALTDAEKADLAEAVAEVERGELASEADVAALLARYSA